MLAAYPPPREKTKIKPIIYRFNLAWMFLEKWPERRQCFVLPIACNTNQAYWAGVFKKLSVLKNRHNKKAITF